MPRKAGAYLVDLTWVGDSQEVLKSNEEGDLSRSILSNQLQQVPVSLDVDT